LVAAVSEPPRVAGAAGGESSAAVETHGRPAVGFAQAKDPIATIDLLNSKCFAAVAW